MTDSTLGVALLGLGRAGRFHLESIRRTPGFRLRHAVDLDEDRAGEVAAAFGAVAATTPDAALADPGVDVVIVATPTGEHVGHICAGLGAGKAVLTEKPLGSSLEEIDTCFDLADEVGRPLLVGFNRRFDPSFASLAASVRHGAVGTPHLVRITSRDSPLPTIEYLRTSHGIFHDCVVHDLDMVRFVTGQEPVEVHAMASSFVPAIAALDDVDNVVVSLRFDSGLLAAIDASRFAAYGYDQRVEAFGDAGMLQAENRSPESTVLATAEGFRRPPIHHSFPTRYAEAYRRELEAFRDCVVDGAPVPVTRSDVRASFVLAEQAEQSWRRGRPMPVA